MNSRQEIAALCVFALVFSYLGYHVTMGERGLVALVQARAEAAENRETLTRLAAERAALERRLVLLSPKTMDLDLAEERARDLLGFARRDEIVLNLAEAGVDPAPPTGR